jgi:3-methyl-2-oxobutanoate hydroxymethyltransferase
MSDDIYHKKETPRITVRNFRRLKQEGKKIAVLTAYDFPTAKILDDSGIDCILVGDSSGTVVAGHKTTLPATMDEMIYLTRNVTRAINRALVGAICRS